MELRKCLRYTTCLRKYSTGAFQNRMMTILILLVAVTLCSGHYDRSGPQHRITWGRGNSHTSAVFGHGPRNVTAVVEHKARLPCNVRNLGHKDVSWIRQRDLHILTVATYTYTTDDRFKVFHQPGTEQWDLDISSVTFRDAGVYECQVSTSPKASLPITLHVLGIQQAVIPGPKEVYIQTGSTISLSCDVSAGSDIVGNMHWLLGTRTLNYSSPRGGISMEVEKTPSSTMSKLYITRALRPDSGNYTCAPQFARAASVLVHVVDAGEESAAAVHSSGSTSHPRLEAITWYCFRVLVMGAALQASLTFIMLSHTHIALGANTGSLEDGSSAVSCGSSEDSMKQSRSCTEFCKYQTNTFECFSRKCRPPGVERDRGIRTGFSSKFLKLKI